MVDRAIWRLTTRTGALIVLITPAQTREGGGVVSNDTRSHSFSNGGLPGIVFTHTVRGTPLAIRDLIGMGPMNPLPCVAGQIGLHCIPIIRTLENFRHSHRTDPKPSGIVALQPNQRR